MRIGNMFGNRAAASFDSVILIALVILTFAAALDTFGYFGYMAFAR